MLAHWRQLRTPKILPASRLNKSTRRSPTAFATSNHNNATTALGKSRALYAGGLTLLATLLLLQSGCGVEDKAVAKALKHLRQFQADSNVEPTSVL